MHFRRLTVAAIALLAATVASHADDTGWTDVTSLFIKNPGYDNDQTTGWQWESNAQSQTARCESMEFWNGTFNLHQTVRNAPKGRYRLSVQTYYRCGDNAWAYENYKNHQEDITAYLYAATSQQQLMSIYAESKSKHPGGDCFGSDGKYFPNAMETARIFFDDGLYRNQMEFEAGGDFTIGLKCSRNEYSNWCIFDNWRLEFYGDPTEVFGQKATPGSLIINEVMASNVDEFLSPAFNFDGWMELYNPTSEAVQLGGLLLSDPVNGEGPWAMPQSMGSVPAKGFRVVWFDSNSLAPENAPFKLDTDGGGILITDDSGREIARQEYPAAMERISYARTTDATGQWAHTATPTPGASNNGIPTAATQLQAPVVDQPSQLFSGQLTIQVDIPEGATLYYTDDGTLPTSTTGRQSTTGQFTVGKTAVYRFRLYADNRLPSPVTSRSYILRDRDYSLPVIAVVTDPDFLYSKEFGVLAKGPNGRPGNGMSDNCNWNMDWERPVNFSYLTADGQMAFNQDANLEVCGGWSRAWDPRPFKLKGNKELGGDKNLGYPFFSQKPYIRNRTLQIRNGGNDNHCRFKDPSLQTIVATSGINIDYQSYQPVHEFINGKYIGVLNMREPNNKHFVYANYGWDDDLIDQFEMSPDSGYVQKCGTAESFNHLVSLSSRAAEADTYAEIRSLLDVDAYANYMAIELYLGNWDWPQNNVKGFRLRDGGRFRFVLFDLDGSFRTENTFNTFFDKERFQFEVLRPSGKRITDDIRFVTLFKNMLQNADFRRQFIDAYCIVGGSVFEKTRATAIVDELLSRVEPAMNLQPASALPTATDVKNNLDNRLSPLIKALKNHDAFGLGSVDYQRVTLSSDTPGATLFINGQAVPTGQFSGYLFAPVTLRAEAPAGYAFSGWTNEQGAIQSSEPAFSLPAGTVQLTASFTPLSASQKREQGVTPVRINEVSGSNDSYIDEYGKKGDWLELYNTTDQAIDTEGMYLTDNPGKPTKYKITKGDTKAQTVIPPHGHLIVWCDNKRATTDRGLHASFKISADGGTLQLTAADQSWTDVIAYGAHDANTTIVRYPDGSPNVFATSVPTIGSSNLNSSYMTAVSQPGAETGITLCQAATSALRLRYVAPQLILHSEDAAPAVVTVCTADGRVVEAFTVSFLASETARIDVSHLAPGFYIARTTYTNGQQATCKFMK